MDTPVLIIGSGLAGLSAAYCLAEQGIRSLVVSKDEQVIEGTNSVYAQGGIVYRSDQDSAQQLEQDILSAGDHINSAKAVHQLAQDGIQLVKKILIQEAQVPFDREGTDLSFTQEAAHSVPRILHVKDHTGRAIMEALLRLTQAHENIRFLNHHVLVDLLTSGHNCRGYEMKYEPNWCIGAYLYDVQQQTVKKVLAPYTLLCTGGVGQVFAYHTNAEHAYGSGLATAHRAGVRIINARFVQFHPTALWTPHKGRRFLISEALRGEGARLKNRKGELLMDNYPQKDLESRAVVSRVIMEELQQSQHEYVLLDLANHYQGEIPISERFPSIYEHCRQEGIDITREAIPVIPAEHFFCGGIAVGLDGQSELPGLFAAGEVACTGVHGANRLASTSLLECLTWAAKAAQSIGTLLPSALESRTLQRAFELVDEWESFGDHQVDSREIELEKDTIRNLMWNSVGILRSKKRLLRAREELRMMWKEIDEKYSHYALSEALIELRHMVEAAYLITLSASSHTSLKEDSLGGHILQ